MVRTAPQVEYDHVILGASHAAVFDFDDMNARLEALTGKRILNLSVVGGGIVVNRLVLDYFLTRHRAATIVYVVDSFAFYSRQWNEERLEDARLFHRAPFDPALARLLAGSGAAWQVTLDYVTGFSKINNADRFAPDVPAEASRFDRRYRPIDQLDRQRIEYLYPAAYRRDGPVDPAAISFPVRGAALPQPGSEAAGWCSCGRPCRLGRGR